METRGIKSEGVLRSGVCQLGTASHRAIYGAAISLLICVCSLFGATQALGAGDINQSACQNEALVGFRSYLPDCRAYELVTPPYKEGYEVTWSAFSLDGDRAIVESQGTFAGSQGSESNAVSYKTIGGGGATYELHRTVAGWSASALAPSPSLFAFAVFSGASAEQGSELTRTVWTVKPTLPSVEGGEGLEELYIRTETGSFIPVGPVYPPNTNPLKQPLSAIRGASGDLSHLLFIVESPASFESSPGVLWPADTTLSGIHPSLYEYAGLGNSVPKLVGLEDNGQLISQCGTELGGPGEQYENYNAVSASGETVFFTALAGGCKGYNRNGEYIVGAGPVVNELYARVEASKTVKISEPILPPGEQCNGECAAAPKHEGIFQGATRDGSKVFFLTEQPLLNEDEEGKGTAMDLYMAELGRNSSGEPAVVKLTQVSHDAKTGEAAEVQGVVRVAEDGSRVYFVAKGALAGKNAEGREPAPKSENPANLYVYDTRTGTTTFVATLLTEAEETSLAAAEAKEVQKVEEIAFARFLQTYEETFNFTKAIEVLLRELRLLPGTLGPTGTLEADKSVWRREDTQRRAQTTPDGRFLVFESSAQLTEDDASSVPQLFEYDAEHGTLARASVSHDGANGDGNVSTMHDAPQIVPVYSAGVEMPTDAQSSLTVSEDGAYVFFTSAADLAPQATGGKANVYEYHNGNVYLLSSGEDMSGLVSLLGTDASGGDVLFTTAEPLVPQDLDTQQDIYDVRVGGGFSQPASPIGCVGDCGIAPSAPRLFNPSSASQVAGENAAAGRRSAHKKKVTHKRKKKAKRRKPRKRTLHKRSVRKRYAAHRLTGRSGR